MYTSFNARAVGLASLDADFTIDLAAAAGFDGVDLMVRDIVMSGQKPELLRAKLDKLGLRAGAFPFPIDWRRDEANFERELASLPPILSAAKVLGLGRTGTWVMPYLPERESSRSAVADLHRRRLGRLARMMGDFGIRIGLEIIGVESFRSGEGDPFIRKMSDLDRELRGIWGESEHMGILADAFHLYASNESVDASLTWGVERIVWVHLADLPSGFTGDRASIIDANRGLPGDHGAVDSKNLLARLANEGYTGPVTVEPLAHCQSLFELEPQDVAVRVKRSLERVWPSPLK